MNEKRKGMNKEKVRGKPPTVQERCFYSIFNWHKRGAVIAAKEKGGHVPQEHQIKPSISMNENERTRMVERASHSSTID